MALSYMGCSVSLQPKRTTQFGRANQKWHHDPDTGLIHAFHTDHLDKGNEQMFTSIFFLLLPDFAGLAIFLSPPSNYYFSLIKNGSVNEQAC